MTGDDDGGDNDNKICGDCGIKMQLQNLRWIWFYATPKKQHGSQTS